MKSVLWWICSRIWKNFSAEVCVQHTYSGTLEYTSRNPFLLKIRQWVYWMWIINWPHSVFCIRTRNWPVQVFLHFLDVAAVKIINWMLVGPKSISGEKRERHGPLGVQGVHWWITGFAETPKRQALKHTLWCWRWRRDTKSLTETTSTIPNQLQEEMVVVTFHCVQSMVRSRGRDAKTLTVLLCIRSEIRCFMQFGTKAPRGQQKHWFCSV